MTFLQEKEKASTKKLSQTFPGTLFRPTSVSCYPEHRLAHTHRGTHPDCIQWNHKKGEKEKASGLSLFLLLTIPLKRARSIHTRTHTGRIWRKSKIPARITFLASAAVCECTSVSSFDLPRFLSRRRKAGDIYRSGEEKARLFLSPISFLFLLGVCKEKGNKKGEGRNRISGEMEGERKWNVWERWNTMTWVAGKMWGGFQWDSIRPSRQALHREITDA